MSSLERPHLSVVIPCLNGARTLGRQLEALLEQDAKFEFEVVVADNGSSDGTDAVIDAWTRCDSRVRRVNASERVGVNHARNVGVQASKSDWIAICDADDAIGPNWLSAYARAFELGGVSLGSGYDAVDENGVVLNRVRELNEVPFVARTSPIGANCAFTRKAYESAGGFDESIAGGGDEIDFFFRLGDLGVPPIYVPGAEIIYRQRTEPKETFRQHWGFGRGMVIILSRYAKPLTRALAYFRIPFGLTKSVVRIMLSFRSPTSRRGALESLGFWCGMLSGILARDVAGGRPVRAGEKGTSVGPG